MTTREAGNAHLDAAFVARARHFAVKVAVAVAFEDKDTLNHADRKDLAGAILEDPDGYGPRFALAVMSNPTLLAAADFDSIPDNDLEFAVNSVYEGFLS